MGLFDGVNSRSVSEASDGFKEFKIGDNHAQIMQVKERVSEESGKLMLEITFADEEGATIRYYIVDGEYKLSRLKQLYAAFKIPVGETDTQKWLGHWGCVVCKAGEPYNGKVYNKVHFVRPEFGETNPQPQSRQPDPPEEPPTDDHFSDDIPF